MIPLLLFLIAQSPAQPSYLRADADIEVREVVAEFIHDGDTFRGADKIDYRLAGINAPEVAHPEYGKPTGDPGGDEAFEALRTMIQSRRVTAFIDRAHPTDRYGRAVAVIVAGDQDVNVSLLRSGYAEPRFIDLAPMIDENAFLAAVSSSEILEPATADSSPVRQDHILTPGDRIRIVVGNQSEDFTINPDGEILIKGLGIVRIVGKTAASATTDFDSAIRAKGIAVSPVTIFYLAPPAKPQRNIMIFGAVNRPGAFQATTLLGTISSAGGFTDEANIRELRITIGDTTRMINASPILAGDQRDIALEGGEIIVVPSLPRILVSGAVQKPDWVSALTLSEAVSAAGGIIPEADLERTEIRADSDTPEIVNLQRIFSGADQDSILPDRARITVPIRPRATAPFVQVYGPVQLPGTQEAFTIADAIREARPDTRADLANVIVDRGSGDTEMVNAHDIALGNALDQDLKTGDRVLIPRRPESVANTPQTVTILGDVKTPGQVPPGTLTQIIASAGGVTNTARTSAIHVRLHDGTSKTYDLAKLTSGRQDNPTLPANSTVYIESDEPRRQSMNDLRTFIGIFSTIALLALRLGG